VGMTRKDLVTALRPTAEGIGKLTERSEIEGLDARDQVAVRQRLTMAKNILIGLVSFLDSPGPTEGEALAKPRRNSGQVSQGKESSVADNQGGGYGKAQVNPH